MERCIEQRGVFPTIVAVDFAGRGDLVATADEHAQQLRSRLGGVDEPATASSTTAVATSTTPPTTAAPVDSGPPLTASLVTQLTGGDPAAFCAVLPDTRKTIYAWALGTSTEPDHEVGQRDLAFGPALARHLPAFISAAPAELAERAQPVLDRASVAVAALQALGLDDDAVAELADRTDQALSAVTGLDTTAAEQDVVAAATEAVGADRFAGAAESFAAANPQTPDLFDLGDVSESVGVPAGYACLFEPPPGTGQGS
jgi:hypothetical protein